MQAAPLPKRRARVSWEAEERISPAISSRAERTQKRRRALLDTARELFAKHGYEETSTEEIVRSVGVTRGTLYSQFRDKAALFAAVYQEQRVALAQSIGERIQVADGAPRQQVVLAVCRAFIEKAADPQVRRILFADGPAVLDQAVIREPDPALQLLRQAFEPLMAEGVIDPPPLDPLIHLMWATCFEAGTYIASADDSAAAQQEMIGTLERVLSGLWSKSPAA